MGVLKFERRSAGRTRGRFAGARWFPLALVGVPLAAFAAVFLAPDPSTWFSGGGASGEGVGDDLAGEMSAGPVAAGFDTERAYFPICDGPRRETCVVDGDTIWYEGEKIRLVGFDTPETWKPKCPNERRLGEQATRRLQALLNAGAFSLDPNPEGESHDHYGRALFVISRGGTNLGEVLVAEGLAERRGGWGKSWC